MVDLGLGLGLEPLKCLHQPGTVTDAHDSNSDVRHVNKIPHVNDFTYLQYFYCRRKDSSRFVVHLSAFLLLLPARLW